MQFKTNVLLVLMHGRCTLSLLLFMWKEFQMVVCKKVVYFTQGFICVCDKLHVMLMDMCHWFPSQFSRTNSVQWKHYIKPTE